MGKFSTLSVAISGMNAAQAGLYVTGHNMANVDTTGYVRQQALQQDFLSVTVGNNARGISQVGLGTDVSQIRQIRDRFLDISYRREAGKHDFYQVKSTVGNEIEEILGELQSQYSTDSVIKDLFNSLQELSIDSQSLASRGSFISTAITFVDKVSNVYNRLVEYQYNLNEQIKGVTQRVNYLLNSIDKYNDLIVDAEVSGDRANDYRDARAVCVDELSHLLNIDYSEKPSGRIDIMSEGKELVVNGVVNQLGLRYTGPNNSFVEPVFTKKSEILEWDADVTPLFDMMRQVSASAKNDSGQLKALMVCRGLYTATYATDPQPPVEVNKPTNALVPGNAASEAEWAKYNQYLKDYDIYKRAVFNMNYALIPKVMKEFDTIVNKVVTMINDAVAPYIEDANGKKTKDPDAPYDLNYDNKGGVEIFVRKYMDRYIGDQYNEEDPDSYFTLYTSGNLMINPKLLEEGGYNLIALMTKVAPVDEDGNPITIVDEDNNPIDYAVEGVSDNSLVLEKLLAAWKDKVVSLGGKGDFLSVDDAYRQFVNNLGVETSESANFADEQAVLLVQVDNKRQAISAVSLDEEMRNMMVYQHAYNAAARVVNTIDSMIDKIINGTGRSGR